jgi:hypothetical protein
MTVSFSVGVLWSYLINNDNNNNRNDSNYETSNKKMAMALAYRSVKGKV